ncbi:Nephrocystin-4 [Chytridiales sp. JEL 0842]|nr:Nephrocystin-4 [Chytridiales sp. JEL 0842]
MSSQVLYDSRNASSASLDYSDNHINRRGHRKEDRFHDDDHHSDHSGDGESSDRRSDDTRGRGRDMRGFDRRVDNHRRSNHSDDDDNDSNKEEDMSRKRRTHSLARESSSSSFFNPAPYSSERCRASSMSSAPLSSKDDLRNSSSNRRPLQPSSANKDKNSNKNYTYSSSPSPMKGDFSSKNKPPLTSTGRLAPPPIKTTGNGELNGNTQQQRPTNAAPAADYYNAPDGNSAFTRVENSGGNSPSRARTPSNNNALKNTSPSRIRTPSTASRTGLPPPIDTHYNANGPNNNNNSNQPKSPSRSTTPHLQQPIPPRSPSSPSKKRMLSMNASYNNPSTPMTAIYGPSFTTDDAHDLLVHHMETDTQSAEWRDRFLTNAFVLPPPAPLPGVTSFNSATMGGTLSSPSLQTPTSATTSTTPHGPIPPFSAPTPTTTTSPNMTSTPLTPFTSPTLTTPLTLDSSRTMHAHLSTPPTSKFPYTLTLDTLTSLPVPNSISDSYLSHEDSKAAPLMMQMRVSLFDCSAGAWVGRTWVDPRPLNLREGLKGGQYGESDDEEEKDRGTRTRVEAKKRKGKGGRVEMRFDEGSSSEEGDRSQESIITSEEEDVRKGKTRDIIGFGDVERQLSKKKKNKKKGESKAKSQIRGRRKRRDSNTDESSEEEDSEAETKSTDDEHDSETGSETDSNSDEDDSEDDSEDEEESDEEESDDEPRERRLMEMDQSAPLGFRGHRITVDLCGQRLYTHTSMSSQHLVAVVEFVLIVESADPDAPGVDHDVFKPEYISAGWTFFHMFDHNRSGLDLEKAWEYERPMRYWLGEEHTKTVPIFAGSPRAMVFIAPLLLERAAGYPGLLQIPGANFTFHFCPRPDLRNMCFLWRENVWVSKGMDVPGLEFVEEIEDDEGDVLPAEMSTATVSKAHISLYPSISKFEENLLAQISLSHLASYPDSLPLDPVTRTPPLPEILERRIHIGLHNTHTFLFPPITTTLQPIHSEHVGGDGFELVFNGNVELEKYVRENPGYAVVFVVEYKVLLITAAEVKKTGIAALLEMLKRGEKKVESLGVEKVVCVGWNAWTPAGQDVSTPIVIPLLTHVGPNPYNSLIYASSFPEDAYREDLDWENYAKLMGRVATRESPIVLSFLFFDEASSGASTERSFPIEAPPVHFEEEEKRPRSPSPVREKPKKKKYDEDEEDMVPVHQTSRVPDASQFPVSRSKLRGQLSRAERARLMSVSFPAVLDEDGGRPLQVAVGPVVGMGGQQRGAEVAYNARVDFDLESRDRFKDNEVTLTLMGVTFSGEMRNRLTGHFPTSVYFTYQFYNFPYCSSNRMCIYTGPLPAPSDTDRGNSFHQRSFSVPNAGHSRMWSHQSHVSQRSFHSNSHGSDESGEQEVHWPGILYPIEEDGSVLFSSPGMTNSYLVEDESDIFPPITSYRHGVSSIAQHLASKSMNIDVWDGDSLLYLGAASVELRPALRQGKPGVYFDEDVDIVLTEYLPDTSTTGGISSTAPTSSDHKQLSAATATGASSDRTTKTTVIGKLHLRMTCVGRKKSTSTMSADPHMDVIKSLRGRKDPYSKDSVIVRDHQLAILTRQQVIQIPKRMPELDPELGELLSSAYEERMRSQQDAKAIREGEERDAKNRDDPEDRFSKVAERNRKLDRIRRIRERENKENRIEGPMKEVMPFNYQMSRQERQRDLQTIDIFRERRKQSTIEKSLTRDITVNHSINASFGQAHYFEYMFTNPYNEEHTFEIAWDDEELRLVVNSTEWKYLRRVYSIRTGIEDKLISVRPDGIHQIFLVANETVTIPFVFQSFVAASTCTMTEGAELPVSFLNNRKMPVAMLDIGINPCSNPIDRSLRFFRSEGELLRRTIRIVQPTSNIIQSSIDSSKSDTSGGGSRRRDLDENSVSGHSRSSSIVAGREPVTVYEASNPGKKYVRCSHPDVICTLADVGRGPSNVKELTFKYRVGPAPETQVIYFLFYDDPHHTSLVEVWRVFVHSLYRLDVNCILGQTNSASLVIRGSTFSRTAQCYSNMPDELMVVAPAPLMLTANSLTEVGLLLRPRVAAVKDIILNVVDCDQRCLISSWLVVSHATTPSVTKAFEITVPKGKSVNKRVSYTNPYNVRKLFRLKTNADHLVQFRDGNALDLEGGASQYIGLRLLPNSNTAAAELLIFLNDEADKIEECLKIKVTYV